MLVIDYGDLIIAGIFALGCWAVWTCLVAALSGRGTRHDA
jgi:hypothetical protein